MSLPTGSASWPSTQAVTQAPASWNLAPQDMVFAFMGAWVLGYLLRMLVRMVQRFLGSWFE